MLLFPDESAGRRLQNMMSVLSRTRCDQPNGFPGLLFNRHGVSSGQKDNDIPVGPGTWFWCGFIGGLCTKNHRFGSPLNSIFF